MMIQLLFQSINFFFRDILLCTFNFLQHSQTGVYTVHFKHYPSPPPPALELIFYLRLNSFFPAAIPLLSPPWYFAQCIPLLVIVRTPFSAFPPPPPPGTIIAFRLSQTKGIMAQKRVNWKGGIIVHET